MTTPEFEIADVKHTHLNRGLIQSDMQEAYTATLKFPGHGWLGLSRYHDEDYWVVDCRFGDNGYPYFSHGTGSRCTSVQVVADETIIAALDDATQTLMEEMGSAMDVSTIYVEGPPQTIE